MPMVASAFCICAAQDGDHLSLIEDAAGLFNERSYLKSNSISLNGNEIINDINGNLLYDIVLKDYPAMPSGLTSALKINA